MGGSAFKNCKELEEQDTSQNDCSGINKNSANTFYETCDNVSKDITAVSSGAYLEEGMPGSGREINFFRRAIINNELSKFVTVAITFYFSVYNNDKLVDMNECQIRDIAKNELSKIDKKETELFDQILSTFKFIEK